MKQYLDDIMEYLAFYKEDIRNSRWEALYKKLPEHIWPSEISMVFLEAYPNFPSMLEHSIFPYCFYTLTIPGNILIVSAPNIEHNAFDACILPKKVVLNNLQFLGGEAFLAAEGVEEVKISSQYSMSWNPSSFMGSTVKAVYLKDCDLGKLPRDTFRDCVNLQTVELPDCMYSIESRAFKNCVHLPSIHLPSNLHEIGRDAFQNCNLNLITTDKSSEEFYDLVGLHHLYAGCIPTVAIQCSDKTIQLPHR